MRKKHKEEHPNYKYQPRRKKPKSSTSLTSSVRASHLPYSRPTEKPVRQPKTTNNKKQSTTIKEFLSDSSGSSNLKSEMPSPNIIDSIPEYSPEYGHPLNPHNPYDMVPIGCEQSQYDYNIQRQFLTPPLTPLNSCTQGSASPNTNILSFRQSYPQSTNIPLSNAYCPNAYVDTDNSRFVQSSHIQANNQMYDGSYSANLQSFDTNTINNNYGEYQDFPYATYNSNENIH